MTLLETRPENLRTDAQETIRTEIPVLRTNRLVLRPPSRADVKAVTALINDRRIAVNTTRIPHPYARADAETFIASANRSEGEAAYLVTLADDDTLVGGCGLMRLTDDAGEIGYWLGVPHWGHGFATEAARAPIDHAFARCGYASLQAGARVSNPASRRVLEKCGFQWTSVGLYRIRALASSAPIDRFRLDRGLWASLKSWGRA